MLGGSGLHRGHIVKAVKAFFFFFNTILWLQLIIKAQMVSNGQKGLVDTYE